MACALLEANNLRDVDGDQAAGKKTLAARLGRQGASWLYVVCVAGVFVGVMLGGEGVVAAVALALYIRPVQIAFSKRAGRELLVLLKVSARTQLALGVVLVATFALTR
jgi:1,4-dihydroxy-2-naphthoate octaprenyltransferase